jgi:hypothetical protein
MSTTITDERRSRLAASIRKLRAYHTIQNEMGRVIVAINFRQPETILEHFALDRADVSLEYADEGVFTGPEAVQTIVRELVGSEPRPGEMIDLHLTTPIIEIADDERTAHAVFWCPGAGAIVSDDGSDPQAIWAWGMIAADLVPSGDTWKVWHFHYFRYIKCSYEKGWVQDTSMINRLNTPVHPLSSPTTYHNPYSPLSVRDGIPAAPRPYATHDGQDWMLEPDKSK